MPVTINGTTGIAGPDGSASTPAVQGTDANTGLFYPAADTVALSTGGSERMRITSGGVVMVGATSAHGSEKVLINGGGTSPTGDGYLTLRRGSDASSGSGVGVIDFADTRTSSIYAKIQAIADATPGTNDFPGALVFYTTADGASSTTERMRIDSAGLVGIGTTTPNTFSFNNLVVASGSANAGMAIYGTGQTTLAFATGTSGGNSFRGYIQYTGGGTDTMAFGTAANERMRITSGGNLLVGTTTNNASGGVIQVSNGITFPATQSASSDANTLDDYEEGTWTPSVGGNATYNYQQGNYTKVGRLVVARFAVSIGTLGTGSTTTLSGLPFSTASVTGRWGGCIHYFAGLAANAISLLIYADGASTNMLFSTVTSSGAGITVDNAAIFGNGAVVQATVIYQV